MPDVPLPPPFEAYTGKEPYLFASYAHADGAIVYPELIHLHKQGYRVWYDEGIDPGNEWPEEVAKALASASHFLVFISPNAVNSKNVRNEINFALKFQKPFLAVYIRETKMPLGLELQTGTIQAVMKYRMHIDMYHRKIEKTLPQNILSRKINSESIIMPTIGKQITLDQKQVETLKPANTNDQIICQDIDGNIYRTVKIGDQIWTAENLKVKRYRNGDSIKHVTAHAQWLKISSGAYCMNGNDVRNLEEYGLLYNWFAIKDTREITPPGWHVPTDEEWKTLEKYLGMSQSDADKVGLRGTDEGVKLKESGTSHWRSPNTGATNESGFTALSGGNRGNSDGSFFSQGFYAHFWSATEYDALGAWYRHLKYDNSFVYRGSTYKQSGFSVRLLRDN